MDRESTVLSSSYVSVPHTLHCVPYDFSSRQTAVEQKSCPLIRETFLLNTLRTHSNVVMMQGGQMFYQIYKCVMSKLEEREWTEPGAVLRLRHRHYFLNATADTQQEHSQQSEWFISFLLCRSVTLQPIAQFHSNIHSANCSSHLLRSVIACHRCEVVFERSQFPVSAQGHFFCMGVQRAFSIVQANTVLMFGAQPRTPPSRYFQINLSQIIILFDAI